LAAESSENTATRGGLPVFATRFSLGGIAIQPGNGPRLAGGRFIASQSISRTMSAPLTKKTNKILAKVGFLVQGERVNRVYIPKRIAEGEVAFCDLCDQEVEAGEQAREIELLVT
jgi:hypothetical protein